MDKENYYPKTQELLYSMALRNDHGFGLYEIDKQDKIVEKMSQLYDCYVEGKTDKEISEQINMYIVTVSQVREEVNGKGFYKPTEESKNFYQSFKKR